MAEYPTDAAGVIGTLEKLTQYLNTIEQRTQASAELAEYVGEMENRYSQAIEGTVQYLEQITQRMDVTDTAASAAVQALSEKADRMSVQSLGRMSAQNIRSLTEDIRAMQKSIAALSARKPVVDMRVSDGYVEYNDGTQWKPLISKKELMGPPGPRGLRGPYGGGGSDTPGGAVQSVNGKTGAVIIESADIAGLDDSIAGKVDKEAGKELILATEATRLATVDNYDDTALNGRVSALETDTHTHSNKSVLDAVTQPAVDSWASAATASHTHTNKTVLDGIEATDVAAWDSAVSDKHTHTNKTVLDGIDSADVAAWDARPTSAQIINLIYPVGAIFMSANNINPGTYLLGTWVAWGAGRVPVGVDASDADFDTAEETGGAKTVDISHTHTTGEHALTVSEMPTHAHSRIQINQYYKAASGFVAPSGSAVRGIKALENGTADGETLFTSDSGGGQSHTHGDTGSAGSASQSIVQPYITCYMFKRIA